MINWETLYIKFGQSKASKKFEDMALDYVRETYAEYSWIPTPRTRDGNRDFHTLQNELLNIWGEAKYKKNSTALTRKDLDPTILSGLIDGTVKLIIFVTNGRIPDELIDRMLLGAKMKDIKLSFILEHQLSDWLFLNPQKYLLYFEEELRIPIKQYRSEQSVELKKVSFFEMVSIDFAPNVSVVEMLIGDIFILNYVIFALHRGRGKAFFERDFPFSLIENDSYDNPKSFELIPGINIISFMVKAKSEYNNTLRVGLEIDFKQYFFITKKILIKNTRDLKIVYFDQLNTIYKIKEVIDNFNFDLGNYMFFIHGKSGMGKSYILSSLSKEYSIKSDITYVTFEKSQYSNINYLILCRILIFLQYGNIIWDFGKSYLKKICLSKNVEDIFTNQQLNMIINGCFDSNIAKTAIHSITKVRKYKSMFYSNKKKHMKILLLDDIQYLNLEQSKFLKKIIKQQLNINSNNILIFSGTKNNFYDSELEKILLENISNYYYLDHLRTNDIKSSIQKNLPFKSENLSTTFINKFPDNLLLFSEILYNLKRILPHKTELSSKDLLNHYIKMYDNNLIFKNKFNEIKPQFYLYDILCLFKKGIPAKCFYKYPLFDKRVLKRDFQKLIDNNCIKFIGNNIIIPYHDYVNENYRNLRKGKEFNSKTGAFIKFLLEESNFQNDENYLLFLLCKCGKKYFNYYNKKIQDLMLKYIDSSQYGTAIYFAELFYENLSTKENKNLSSLQRYYLYLYADCLVHCDNQYRAKELLKEQVEGATDYSFEKYEAAISLINQKFWSIDLNGIIEDSKIYQVDLEVMFMHNIKNNDLRRFIKSYEACFNRRMVTFLLTDKCILAQKTYQEGLKAIKKFCMLYNLEYFSEIATIIMDYARGMIIYDIKLSNRLFTIASKIFEKNKINFVRRNLICQSDLLVSKHILEEKINYIFFNNIAQKLDQCEFTLEYIKTIMKIYACRLIDNNKLFRSFDNVKKHNSSLYDDMISKLQECLLDKQIILQNREKFLYNYLLSYIYICRGQYTFAKKLLLENLEYVKEAGDSYRIPLLHNLKNLRCIKSIHWYQHKQDFDKTIFILESRFW